MTDIQLNRQISTHSFSCEGNCSATSFFMLTTTGYSSHWLWGELSLLSVSPNEIRKRNMWNSTETHNISSFVWLKIDAGMPPLSWFLFSALYSQFSPIAKLLRSLTWMEFHWRMLIIEINSVLKIGRLPYSHSSKIRQDTCIWYSSG